MIIHCVNSYKMCFNPFPNDKILDLTKLKAFVDDKLDLAKMTILSLTE